MMKKHLFLVFVVCCFISCKNFHYLVQETIQIKSAICPENTDCALELIPNSSISFKNDEFGNVYPEISKGNNTLLQYTLNKNTPKNTQDGHYTEHIYAELYPIITKTSLKNEELKIVKLHFGRLCYCKGETGYYAIKNGEFKIQKVGKDSINISLLFQISEVPQITSNINETISIK